ncbi:MAG: DUF3047 domain-containing protein, partial [Betaproteobacteria bacterium]
MLLALTWCPATIAADAAPSVVAAFSASAPGAALPAPWRIAKLPGVERATRYTLVADGETVVLRADATASMASVVHALTLDSKAFPVITWRWKVGSVVEKSDLRTKAGD